MVAVPDWTMAQSIVSADGIALRKPSWESENNGPARSASIALSNVASTSRRRIGRIVEPEIQYTSKGNTIGTVVDGGIVVVVVLGVGGTAVVAGGDVVVVVSGVDVGSGRG